MEYWERVAAVIHLEPVEDRDRFFMAVLKPLGIEKGQPFQARRGEEENPDGRGICR
jgi:hypothetical protein